MERLSEDNIKKAKQWLSDQYLALDFECGDMPHILGVLSKALRALAEQEHPKPLTLEQLKERNTKAVFVSMRNAVSPGEWYIVDIEEMELSSPWDKITLDGWDDGDYFKAYDHEPKEAVLEGGKEK